MISSGWVMPKASYLAETPGTRASARESYLSRVDPTAHGPFHHSVAFDASLDVLHRQPVLQQILKTVVLITVFKKKTTENWSTACKID